jgi:hypothetical protein
MKRKLTLVVALLLFGLAMSGSDCILEDKVVQLVVLGESCTDEFDEYHTTSTWTTPKAYDVSDELDAILADNGVDKDQIISAKIISATYMVTDPPGHDWMLSGTITVEYGAEYETIVNYTNQSLWEIDDVAKYADLNEAGVNVFHQAIQDYLDGASPVLTFRVENGDVDPDPSGADPIDFKWIACLKIYVVVEEDYEWPDVFRG